MEPPAQPMHSWSIRDSRVHFIGKPTLCLGHIHLQNDSPGELRVNRIPFAASKLIGPVEVPIRDLQFSARLLPGGSFQTSARLLIPPQTPPGRYSAELLVGARRKPVTIDVLESWDLAIVPLSLALKVRAVERVGQLAQLTNRGNMPFALRRATFAPLDEAGAINRSISLSLRNKKPTGYQDVLNEFAKLMAETEVEPAKVKIVSEADVLQPGESQELKLEISLPPNLIKNRRYTGEILFENARLRLDLEILGNAGAAGKESNA